MLLSTMHMGMELLTRTKKSFYFDSIPSFYAVTKTHKDMAKPPGPIILVIGTKTEKRKRSS